MNAAIERQRGGLSSLCTLSRGERAGVPATNLPVGNYPAGPVSAGAFREALT